MSQKETLQKHYSNNHNFIPIRGTFYLSYRLNPDLHQTSFPEELSFKIRIEGRPRKVLRVF